MAYVVRLKASISLVPGAAGHIYKSKQAHKPFQERHLTAGSLKNKSRCRKVEKKTLATSKSFPASPHPGFK